VNRFLLLVMAVLVLASPGALTAQMGGGHGGSGRSSGGRQSPAPGDNSTAADDFHKAIALQATDDQRAQFHMAEKHTDAARKLAEDLRQSIGQPEKSPDYQTQAAKLKASIDNAQSATHAFLQGFDKGQTSGLKDPIKKLNKAGGNLESAWKSVSRELEQSKANHQKLSAAADELVRALTDFRSRQAALGDAMGIQD
jgi:chromosome segregation ATPase